MLKSLKTYTAALSLYFFITLAKVELENVGLAVSEILEVFLITLNAHDKYSLRNRKKLSHSVNVQLYKKQKKYSQFFGPYLKSASNVE